MSSSSSPLCSRNIARLTSPMDCNSATRSFQRVGIAFLMLARTTSRATGSSSKWHPAGRKGKFRSICRCRSWRLPPRRPGSGGRSGTRGDAVPRSRARCIQPCPRRDASLVPSCWRNKVPLSVGRSIKSVSTFGRSMPSLKRSTVNSTAISPAARSRESRVSLLAESSRPILRERECRALQIAPP